MLTLFVAFFIFPIWSNLPSGSELRQLSESVETRLEEIPEHVQLAMLAAEQTPDFLADGPNGISCVVKAFTKMSDERKCNSSISTIVARNIFQERSQFKRYPNWAFRHFFMVVKIEHYLTPEQILELALSQTYFGSNTFGIAQAARFFFDKDPANLSLAESALLAGLIKAPSHYSPISRPESALIRRNQVLQFMVTYNMITDLEGATAMAEPLSLIQ